MQKTFIRKPVSVLLSLLIVLCAFGAASFTAGASGEPSFSGFSELPTSDSSLENGDYWFDLASFLTDAAAQGMPADAAAQYTDGTYFYFLSDDHDTFRLATREGYYDYVRGTEMGDYMFPYISQFEAAEPPVHVHNYVFDSFIWAADNTAQAQYVCSDNSCADVQYYDAEVSSVPHDATCDADAYTVYTASYDGHSEDRTVTELGTAGHDYAFASFVWAADNTAKAKYVCTRNVSHVEYFDAEVRSETTAPTATEDGFTVYTATYAGHTDRKTVVDEGSATGEVPSSEPEEPSEPEQPAQQTLWQQIVSFFRSIINFFRNLFSR